MILDTGIDLDLSEASFEEAIILLKVQPDNCVELTIIVHPSYIVEAGRVSANLGSFDNVKIHVKADINYSYGDWMVVFEGRSVSSKGA